MTINVRALVASSAAPKHGRCRTCAWLAGRDDDEAAEWRGVLAEGARRAQVARAMAKADPDGAPPLGSLEEHVRNHHDD